MKAKLQMLASFSPGAGAALLVLVILMAIVLAECSGDGIGPGSRL